MTEAAHGDAYHRQSQKDCAGGDMGLNKRFREDGPRLVKPSVQPGQGEL
ncbi:MAG: hypothetical protein AAFQ11_02685 [Pseudomonadota bacterium]